MYTQLDLTGLCVCLLVFYAMPSTLLVILRQVDWKHRENQYKQSVKVLYCKLLTNGKQLPAFPLGVGL